MTTADKEIIANILEQYDRNLPLLAELKNRQLALLTELIREQGLVIHSISGAIMERVAIIRRLEKADTAPSELFEIDDLVTIGITVFFADEIDKVAKIIKDEFNVVKTHQLDQGPDLDPDRFGYVARHYQTELLENRLKLIEYSRFEGFQTRIHVFSVLQQAWAQIMERLDNPGRKSLPKERQREFIRTAGLLELADEQFNNIKDFIRPAIEQPTKIRSLQADPSLARPLASALGDADDKSAEGLEETATEPIEAETRPLNRDELASFIITNPLVNRLDRQIQEIYNAPLQYQDVVIDRLLESVAYFHFTSRARLEEAMQKQKHVSLRLATHIFGDPSEEHYEFLPVGISMSLFFFVLVASTGRKDLISQYTHTYSFLNEEANEDVAQHLSSWYQLATE